MLHQGRKGAVHLRPSNHDRLRLDGVLQQLISSEMRLQGVHRGDFRSASQPSVSLSKLTIQHPILEVRLLDSDELA